MVTRHLAVRLNPPGETRASFLQTSATCRSRTPYIHSPATGSVSERGERGPAHGGTPPITRVVFPAGVHPAHGAPGPRRGLVEHGQVAAGWARSGRGRSRGLPARAMGVAHSNNKLTPPLLPRRPECGFGKKARTRCGPGRRRVVARGGQVARVPGRGEVPHAPVAARAQVV
mgnify:CR=1 FL=1